MCTLLNTGPVCSFICSVLRPTPAESGPLQVVPVIWVVTGSLDTTNIMSVQLRTRGPQFRSGEESVGGAGPAESSTEQWRQDPCDDLRPSLKPTVLP